MMLGSNCSPCCGLPDCDEVLSQFSVVSGAPSLLSFNTYVEAESPFVAVTQQQWFNQTGFFDEQDLPPQFSAELAITAGASSEWRIAPASVEARFWCDASGSNAALTGRLRVEFGTLIARPDDIQFGDDFMAVPLASHTLAAKKSYPQNFVNAMQEVRIFFDWIGPGGSVVETISVAHDESCIQTRLSFDNTLALSVVIADLHASVVGGQMFARVRLRTLGSAASVHVMPHIEVVPQNSKAAIALTSSNNALGGGSVSKYPSYPPVLNCLPPDKTFCNSISDARRRPLYSSNCSTIAKASRVRGAACDLSVSGITLTISGTPNTQFFFDVPQVGPEFFSALLGSYELSPVSGFSSALSECQFWYEDSPGIPVASGATFERIEISASCFVDANPAVGASINSCVPVTAKLAYSISIVQRNPNGTGTRFTSGSFAVLPESFLFGSPAAATTDRFALFDYVRPALTFGTGPQAWRGTVFSGTNLSALWMIFDTGGVSAQLV